MTLSADPSWALDESVLHFCCTINRTSRIHERLKCLQVEGLLDRSAGQPPVIQYIVEQFEQLGYASWAHRIINTAGEDGNLTSLQHSCMEGHENKLHLFVIYFSVPRSKACHGWTLSRQHINTLKLRCLHHNVEGVPELALEKFIAYGRRKV